MIDSGDGKFSADLVHTPYGYPLWYGREIPSPLTRHSVTYGYNWAGDVSGTFTYKNGKVINLTSGNGELSIRQWHEYPRILPRELYIDEEQKSTTDKFSTL